jgi:hypothetical protein
MTSTSPDLPRPNPRGFPRDSYDIVRNHRGAPREYHLRAEQRQALKLLASGRPWLQPVDAGVGLVRTGLATEPGGEAIDKPTQGAKRS